LCCAEFQKTRNDEANEQLLAALKAEKEELEATLSREGLQTVQLKEEITEAEVRNAELTKASLLFYLAVALFLPLRICSLLCPFIMHSLSII
jgi:uncharacterized membrane protein